MRTGPSNAFTLIELLIVVAIIAILASIALPNFLEAQVRAKVSRTKTDLRSVSTAIETYAVDNNAYPEPLEKLSTPVSYIGDAYARDVFANPDGWFALGYVQARAGSQPGFLQMWGVTNSTAAERQAMAEHNFFVFSNGPDLLDEAIETPNTALRDVIRAPNAQLAYYYDPTNGTLSRGDIMRTGKHTP